LTMGNFITSLNRWFIYIQLSYSHLTFLSMPFPLSVQYPTITDKAPRGGLVPPLAQRHW
jgi:hypothetical protein